ncbi:MAG: methionine adenosyltransferase [Desulfuromonadales bacterium]|nr:methionine adenosyltransferase [Desulfuromonadales bacterium]
MDRNNVIITSSRDPMMDQQEFELVERKGTGHPDTICDAVVEAVGRQLCREYQARFGRILHHNVDKSFLVAGQSQPRPGGGEIIQPMRFILGDRAVHEFQGKKIPLAEIAEQAVSDWFKSHLRFVDPQQHLVFQNEIKPGSDELIDSFLRRKIGANDTSVGVGYAPLSSTEELVLALEKWLNSAAFKTAFPVSGEDIKIMAYRRARNLKLVVAMAFVDRYVESLNSYFTQKAKVLDEIQRFVESHTETFAAVNVELNALDDRSRGEAGLYLTVLGTSAEAGDSGQVGRGNRVNGIISYNRPATTEAAAGKNPVSHTGKIYNILSHQLAAKIHATLPEITEVNVWLCSKIGQPLDQPLAVAAEIKTAGGIPPARLRNQVAEIVFTELAGIDTFSAQQTQNPFAGADH